MVSRAHWNILTDCNLSCAFCYLWRRDDVRLWNTQEALGLVDQLALNVDELVFGGGDPLMREDIVTLVEHAKSRGLKVELHTNAALIDGSDVERLFKSLDRLGLSLDGEDEITHDSFRAAKGNFRANIRALELADRLALPTTVRTLLTRRNLDHVEGIGRTLGAYRCVEKWSIRQFVPLGRGAKSKKAYHLNNTRFSAEAEALASRAVSLKPHFKVGVVSDEDMANCYCLIAEDGTFYQHPDTPAYTSVGKFPEEPIATIFQRLNYDRERRQSRSQYCN
jgi:MoaA/NifB/PqqE/SkfB family radical SAM enzyme